MSAVADAVRQYLDLRADDTDGETVDFWPTEDGRGQVRFTLGDLRALVRAAEALPSDPAVAETVAAFERVEAAQRNRDRVERTIARLDDEEPLVDWDAWWVKWKARGVSDVVLHAINDVVGPLHKKPASSTEPG